jgi:hypothetical protein
MILSFIIGAAIGFKICEIFLVMGIQSMIKIKDSGVEFIEEGNKLIIEIDKIEGLDDAITNEIIR